VNGVQFVDLKVSIQLNKRANLTRLPPTKEGGRFGSSEYASKATGRAMARVVPEDSLGAWSHHCVVAKPTLKRRVREISCYVIPARASAHRPGQRDGTFDVTRQEHHAPVPVSVH
jgi:hypothetical protein